MHNELKTKKIKIAFLLYSLTGGGAERIVSILLNDLAITFEVYLVLFNNPVVYELNPGVQLKLLRKESRFRMLRLLSLPLVGWRYRVFCRKHKIQISVSFDNLANYINAAFCDTSGGGTRIILSERNPPSVQFGRYSVHHTLIRKLYAFSQAIVSCSEGVSSDLAQQYRLPSRLLHRIYNPLPVAKIIEFAKGDSSMQNNIFSFVHVGSFRAQKNHLLLLEAFSKLRHTEVELWLIGQGPLEAKIRSRALELGLEGRVRFTGFLTNPFAVMAQAGCLVCSSDFEGFPNAVLEGLACSLPVISTDCRFGPREILAPDTDFSMQIKTGIEKATYGILTPVGDVESLHIAMMAMYEDVAMRNLYRQKALESIKRFDHQTIIPIWEEFLIARHENV